MTLYFTPAWRVPTVTVSLEHGRDGPREQRIVQPAQAGVNGAGSKPRRQPETEQGRP